MESTELMETDSDNGLDEDPEDDVNEFETVLKCYSWYCQILLQMYDFTGSELPLCNLHIVLDQIVTSKQYAKKSD
jgi:hypothetical protein